MAGTALQDFADFVEATGPTYVTGPKSIINAATKRKYLWARLADGELANRKTVSGGSEIRESIVFQDNGTWEKYLPGQNHNWVNPQRLQKIVAQWRYGIAHMSWVEQEILLNERIAYGTDEAMFHQFVDIRNEKEMIMWTAVHNGVENDLWKTPDKDTMEATDGVDTYPILAFVNEDPNGLWGSGWAANPWTTVEGIDPTASAIAGNFTPQQVTYSSSAANNSDNIVSKFDEMWKKVYFEKPSTFSQYFDDPYLNKQTIITSSRGQTVFQQLLREGQDHYVLPAGQDPAYPDPQFHGIPVEYNDTFEAGNFYKPAAGSVPTTEALADLKGPRFLWLNGQYLYPVFHDEMYFVKKEITKHHNVPDTWVCPVNVYYNSICTSRRNQGIVSPSADLYFP